MKIKKAAKPIMGSFFIIEGKVYYNYDGMDHLKLWELLVDQVFGKLDWDNRMELRKACYAADRGRITWKGKLDMERQPIGQGSYMLYGTPGCAKYVGKIKNIFKLTDIGNLELDWHTDEHYKTLPSDVSTLEDMMRLVGDKLNLKDTHLPVIKHSTLVAKVIKKLQK